MEGLCFAGYAELLLKFPFPFPDALAKRSLTSEDKTGLGKAVSS